ncbi:MAG: YceI family protein [Acidobacteria bacterium]|nr:YceI family protein [Acidobacteriota bacterium]
MKRTILFLVFALAAGYLYLGTGVDAFELTLNERFAAQGALPAGESGTYNFDKAHSFIGFKVKHMGLVEVPGYFRDFTGAVTYDAKDPSKSTVEFTAKATSVDTGVAPRDNHLRSADFFEVEKFPDLSFKSTKVEKKGASWIVTGDFTLKGVTKSMSFPFNISGFLPADQRSGGKMGITAETSFNRRDYGVNYGSNMPNGTPVLSDDVKVVLQIEANRPKPTPAAAPAGE